MLVNDATCRHSPFRATDGIPRDLSRRRIGARRVFRGRRDRAHHPPGGGGTGRRRRRVRAREVGECQRDAAHPAWQRQRDGGRRGGRWRDRRSLAAGRRAARGRDMAPRVGGSGGDALGGEREGARARAALSGGSVQRRVLHHWRHGGDERGRRAHGALRRDARVGHRARLRVRRWLARRDPARLTVAAGHSRAHAIPGVGASGHPRGARAVPAASRRAQGEFGLRAGRLCAQRRVDRSPGGQRGDARDVRGGRGVARSRSGGDVHVVGGVREHHAGGGRGGAGAVERRERVRADRPRRSWRWRRARGTISGSPMAPTRCCWWK